MRSSSRVWIARTVLAVVAAFVVVVSVIKPQLALYAALGLYCGWMARAIIRRQWKTVNALFVGAGVLFTLAVVVFLAWAVLNGCGSCGSPDIDRISVPMSSSIEWNGGEFAITDNVTVTDKAAAAIVRSVVTRAHPMPEAELDPFIAAMSASERSEMVRSNVTDAGWTSNGSTDGAPTFERHRTVEATVPRWPLSVRRSIDVAEIQVDGEFLVLLPDGDSVATLTVPEHLVRRTFPSASSREPTLDGDSEMFTVPYSYAPGVVRIELLSPLARNRVVSSVVGFSAWGAAKWIVLLAIAVLTDGIKEAMKAGFGRIKRAFAKKEASPDPQPENPIGPYL